MAKPPVLGGGDLKDLALRDDGAAVARRQFDPPANVLLAAPFDRSLLLGRDAIAVGAAELRPIVGRRRRNET